MLAYVKKMYAIGLLLQKLEITGLPFIILVFEINRQVSGSNSR